MDVSDILYFFLLREGEGFEALGGGGDRFFIENPTRGVSRGGGRGREGVCGELGIFFWGGVAKYFSRDRNVHQAKQVHQSSSKGNFFVRVRLRRVPSTVEEVVRVRFCCLLG